MRRWISSVDRTTKRVFVAAVITMLLLPWMALVADQAGDALPLPIWAIDLLRIMWIGVLLPPFLVTEAVWGVSSVAAGFPIIYGTLLFIMAYGLLLGVVLVIPYATLVTVAFVLVRHFRERRASSREV